MVSPFIDNELTRSSLRGIKQIYIFVQPIDSELIELGITEDQILTAVELKLRMAGIHPLSEPEAKKFPDCPTLMVFSAASLPKGAYDLTYAVSLGLAQDIILTRNEAIKSVGLTWGCGPITGIIAGGQTEIFRNKIKDLLDNFVYACLSVNH
jgi:hypothetical protein